MGRPRGSVLQPIDCAVLQALRGLGAQVRPAADSPKVTAMLVWKKLAKDLGANDAARSKGSPIAAPYPKATVIASLNRLRCLGLVRAEKVSLPRSKNPDPSLGPPLRVETYAFYLSEKLGAAAGRLWTQIGETAEHARQASAARQEAKEASRSVYKNLRQLSVVFDTAMPEDVVPDESGASG